MMVDVVDDRYQLALDVFADLVPHLLKLLLIPRLGSRVICCLKLKPTELSDDLNDESRGEIGVGPLEQGWPSGYHLELGGGRDRQGFNSLVRFRVCFIRTPMGPIPIIRLSSAPCHTCKYNVWSV